MKLAKVGSKIVAHFFNYEMLLRSRLLMRQKIVKSGHMCAEKVF